MSGNTKNSMKVSDVLKPLVDDLFSIKSIKQELLRILSDVVANNMNVYEGLERIGSYIEDCLADESILPDEKAIYEYAQSKVDDAYLKLGNDLEDANAWQKVDVSDYVDGLD